MERIHQQSDNPDLQYLYFCMVTDFGLLVRTDPDPTNEQIIRNYFHQQEALQELIDFCKIQNENFRKYRELLEYLKKPIKMKNAEYVENRTAISSHNSAYVFIRERRE